MFAKQGLSGKSPKILVYQTLIERMISEIMTHSGVQTSALGHKFVSEQECQSLALAGGGRRSRALPLLQRSVIEHS
jgi:hypothetical protein